MIKSTQNEINDLSKTVLETSVTVQQSINDDTVDGDTPISNQSPNQSQTTTVLTKIFKADVPIHWSRKTLLYVHPAFFFAHIMILSRTAGLPGLIGFGIFILGYGLTAYTVWRVHRD